MCEKELDRLQKRCAVASLTQNALEIVKSLQVVRYGRGEDPVGTQSVVEPGEGPIEVLVRRLKGRETVSKFFAGKNELRTKFPVSPLF